jgi:GGDEF domain-containing protein
MRADEDGRAASTDGQAPDLEGRSASSRADADGRSASSRADADGRSASSRGFDKDPRAAAERLRSAISDDPIATRSVTLTVTVSVGAAVLRAEDGDVEALLGRADQRLYEAKRGGRNRVATD